MVRRDVLFLMMAACMGCSRRDRSKESVFEEADDIKNILMLLIDLSPSFVAKVGESGKAYTCLKAACERYFRDSVGTSDRVVIGKIAGNDHSMIWEGKPKELQADFPKPDVFQRFLLKHQDGGGSFVHDGMNRALRYLLSKRGVKDGRVKTVTLVLSDMEDNGSRDAAQRLLGTLTEYGEAGGVVGIYYCDDDLLERWNGVLAKAGIRDFHVEGEFVGMPVLPVRQ